MISIYEPYFRLVDTGKKIKFVPTNIANDIYIYNIYIYKNVFFPKKIWKGKYAKEKYAIHPSKVCIFESIFDLRALFLACW